MKVLKKIGIKIKASFACFLLNIRPLSIGCTKCSEQSFYPRFTETDGKCDYSIHCGYCGKKY